MMWDEGKLKYDRNKEYDIAFGEEYSQRSGKTEVYSYSNMSQDKRLIALAKVIIMESLKAEASDIKIYRYDTNNAFVELRIGDKMVKTRRIDIRAVSGLVQAFKRMAGMDVSETTSKTTGDGRISFEAGGIPYNLRVNSIPSIHSETMSIRIIKSDDNFNNVEYLGFPDFVLERFRKVLNQNEGMIILSGGTGSGKSLPELTRIPTPEGVKKLNELKVGDKVYDNMGKTTKVIGVYPQGSQKTYKVLLSDNSEVKASHDHLWAVEMKDSKGVSNSKVMTTSKIKGSILTEEMYIPNIYQPIECGTESNIKSEIYYRDKGIEDTLNYVNKKEGLNITFKTIQELTTDERKAYIEGLINLFRVNDYYEIPEEIGGGFIQGLNQLVTSLGYSLYFDNIEDVYHFSFNNELEYKGRYIVSVEEVEEEESICIEVESKDSLFLVTQYFIPTHNTTTLYTALKEIIRTTRGVKNIHTIEDPVESLIPGTVQNEVNELDGFSYNHGVRGLLRQNPDIILIGEIRDAESAKTALRAATSGHLLLSTLHTNNALMVPMVMQQYGLKKNEIASALQMVLNQRLVGKLCDNCKEVGSIKTKDLNYLTELGLDTQNIVRVAGKSHEGCSECEYTGYKGKVLIVEMLDADRNFDEVLNQSNNDFELKINLEKSQRKSYYSKEEDVERHLRNMSIDFKTASDVIR